jgi:hypothetical protein
MQIDASLILTGHHQSQSQSQLTHGFWPLIVRSIIIHSLMGMSSSLIEEADGQKRTRTIFFTLGITNLFCFGYNQFAES